MLRNWPIRTKLVVILVVPLAALAALSAVAVRGNVENVRAGDRTRTLADFAITTNDLIHVLQRERLVAAAQFTAPARAGGDINAARAEVDRSVTAYRERERALSDTTRNAVVDTLATSGARLSALDQQRKRYDERDPTLTQEGNTGYYSALISELLVLDTQVGSGSRDTELVARANTLASFSQAKEAVAYQQGYVASLLFSTLPPQFVAQVAQIVQNAVGAEDAWLTQFRTTATAGERQFYDATVSSAADQVAQLRDVTISTAQAGQRPTLDPYEWLSAIQSKIDKMRDVERRVATELGAASRSIAANAARDAWLGGIGVTLVLALSITISLLVASPMIRQLRRLRRSALETANQRLPGVVDRLHRGEPVDASEEAFPNPHPSRDEIGQLADAFGTVHRVAVATAVEQAAMRKSIGDTFLNLARRSQALIHRQLKIIDALERKETDPDELDELFRLDHLATRMRRHAEDLIVLSGSKPARGWRRPVPVKDVIRGAVAEVEDYTRVKVLPVNAGAISGHAVGDVIHMLAELIENATSFSPPHTPVHVSGHEVSNGAAIEIEDRGLGMTDEELTAINERLANPPPFDLKTSERLGLFVVGRLAERHQIKVKLRPSPYGGTMAIVLVPSTLLRDDELDSRSAPAGVDSGGVAALPMGSDDHEPRELTAVGASTTATPASGIQLDGDAAYLVESSFDRTAERSNETPYERAVARFTGTAPVDEPGNDDDSPLMDDLPVFATVRSSWFVADRDRADGQDRPWGPPSERPGATTVGPPPTNGEYLSSGGAGAAPFPPPRGSVLDAHRVDSAPSGASGGGRGAGGSGGSGGGGGAAPSSPSGSTGSSPGSFGLPSPLGGPGAAPPSSPSRPVPPLHSSPSGHQTTDVGLPKRTRRASLAPELRRNSNESSRPVVASGPRSPDEIRSMMTSFQTNFGRGLEDSRGPADDDPPTTNRGR